jgi:hypothetical protein
LQHHQVSASGAAPGSAALMMNARSGALARS